MATDTRKQQRSKAGKRQTVKVQDYVAEKLNKTRRQVRHVDVMSHMITLVSIVLVFLLTVAIIDAWIMPLGTLGRWAGFLTLLIGMLAFIGLVIGRSLVRKVNPDYAAQMIEESQPGFKNSLLNYVSLSRKPQGTKAAVMDAVSRQAATDISKVPVEALVDRSAVIRVSLILAGIILFGALYTLFSPKSPFQSMARVMFPSAKLAAPSVVTIKDVTPGDAEAFFGDEIEVSALVVGSHSPEDVKLVFSTKDGQIVDRVIPMTVESGTTDRYVAPLSTDGSGIQQALTYHIVARDGATPEFTIDVRTNPSIAIEQVSLEPPKYSKIKSWTQPQGNIEALEGTRVTINAKANLPIESAEIELLNLNGKGDFVTARKVLMNTQPDNMLHSVGSFNMEMNKRRTRQAATHYRLNFVSTEGHKNQQPNNFPIKVIPDLAPEIKVVNPLEKATSIPIDASATIRVQANDADFEISKIELEFQHNDQRIFGEPMQLQPVKGMQLVNGDFVLNVSQQFPLLNVGDQLVFHATAFDNRTASNGLAAANETQSENYVIEIAEPINQERRDPNENRDPNQQQPEEQEPNPFDPPKEPEQQPEPNQFDPPKEQEQDPQGMNPEQQQDRHEGDQPQPNEGNLEQPGQEKQQQPGERNEPGQQGQPGNEQDEQPEGDPQKNGGDRQQEVDRQQNNGMQQGPREQQWQEDQGEQQARDGDAQPPNTGDQDGNEGAPEENPNGQQGNQDPNQGGEPGPENDADRMKKLNEMLGNSEEQDPSDGNQDQPGQEQNDPQQPGDNQQPDQAEMQERQGDPQSEQGQEGSPQNGEQGDQPGQQPQGGKQGDPQGEQSQEGNPQNGEQGDQPGQQPQGGKQGDPQGEQGQEGSPQNGEQGDQPGQQPQGGKQGDPQSEQGQEGNPQNGEQGDQPGQQPQGGKQGDPQGEQGQEGSPQNGEQGDQPGQQPQGGKQGDPQRGDGSGQPKGEQQSEESNPQQQQENPQSSEGDENGNAKGSSGSKPGDESKNGAPAEESPDGKPSGEKGKQPGKGKGEGEQGEKQQGIGEEQKPGEGEGGKPGEGEGGKPGEGEGGKPGEGEGDGKAKGEGEGGGKGKGEGEGGGKGKGEGEGGGKGKGEGEGGGKGKGEGEGKGQGNGGGDQQGGGGEPGPQAGSGPGSGPDEAPMSEEEANMEFSKKTTDMILNRLKKQRNNPNQELLDAMNWTKDDMNRFIDRWEKMQKDAANGNEADKKRFEKQLKGLGLRPSGSASKSKLKGDGQEDYLEDSAIDRIMPELRSEFQAFQREQNRSDR